jgi:ABC-2 type transport system ATP-binding protein
MTFGVDGVTVTYGDAVALDGVTMEVRRGEVTAVVGGDGSGKSTLLRVLAGLTEPTSGEVRRPGKDEIGFFPTGAGSWPHLTVAENVDFVGGSYGLRGTELADRSGDLLELAGLAGVRHRLSSQLSGGMRNKLGFCLAMLSDPALLILDEPTTGVDPVSRIDLWSLISRTAAGGTAVLMATTYMDEAERTSSVTLLNGGRKLLDGSPDELLASIPGDVAVVERPTDAERSWRSGSTFRQWFPSGAPDGSDTVSPTLGDVSIVAQLAARSGRTSGAP